MNMTNNESPLSTDSPFFVSVLYQTRPNVDKISSIWCRIEDAMNDNLFALPNLALPNLNSVTRVSLLVLHSIRFNYQITTMHEK